MAELENAGQQNAADAGADLTGQPDNASGDPGASAAQSMPEAQLPEIEIQRDGQVIKVPFGEAKDYVQKGYDYTQKTMELAKEKDSLKPYQELATYLQSNPEKARTIYETLTQEQGEVDPVQQRIGYLEQSLNQVIQQSSQEKLNGMLNTIHNDPKYEGLFKDSDMEELLLASALQTKKTNMDGLKSVADKIHSKWLKSSVEAQKKGEKKVIENLNSPTRKGESGAGTFTPPKGFDPAKASWKEVHKRAVEML